MKKYVIVSEVMDGKFKGQKHYINKKGHVLPYGFNLTQDSCYNSKKQAENLAKKLADDDKLFELVRYTTEYTIEEIEF